MALFAIFRQNPVPRTGGRKLLRWLALALVLTLPASPAWAGKPGCVGKMWNPLGDLDFRLMGGIRIAGFALMPDPKLGEPPNHKTDPICYCENGLETGYGLGITFWLPSYIGDVARQPGCLGFLNGINILPGFAALASGQAYNENKPRQDSVTNMQVHWAYADITAIAGKSLFEKCNAVSGSLEIAYLTEVDFVFQNDVYSAILSPQVALLAAVPLLSQMACGYEQMANTLGDWQDMGICGWGGTRLPLTANSIGKNSAQVTNMDVMIKYLTRSALLGTSKRTMGEDAVCKPKYAPFYEAFQHRYQWSFPGKVSTRFNVDMLRWGMFIKDDGQTGLFNLTSEAAQLAGVNSTQAVGSGATAPSGNNLSLAESIVSRLPKPLNYPTKEAGYMQVWEARQCCLMVLTISNVIEFVIENLATMGNETIAELYEYYEMASSVYAVYEFATDPLGAALDAVGGGITSALSSAGEGIANSLSGLTL